MVFLYLFENNNILQFPMYILSVLQYKVANWRLENKLLELKYFNKLINSMITLRELLRNNLILHSAKHTRVPSGGEARTEAKSAKIFILYLRI